MGVGGGGEEGKPPLQLHGPSLLLFLYDCVWRGLLVGRWCGAVGGVVVDDGRTHKTIHKRTRSGPL